MRFSVDGFIVYGIIALTGGILWLYKVAFAYRGTRFGIAAIFLPPLLLFLLEYHEGRYAWMLNVLGCVFIFSWRTFGGSW